VKDDNEDMISTEELNKVFKRAKNRKSCGLETYQRNYGDLEETN